MRRTFLAALVVVLGSVAPSAAFAEGTGGRALESFGVSEGAPNDGALVGGERLPTGPHLRILPAYAGRNADWGLAALVSLLDGASRDVRRAYPDAVASFGDLSHPGGRELSHHHSHESGRDADVAFFLSDNRGHAWLQNEYVRIDANGRAPTHGGVLFDDARNWAFVRALVTSPRARVMSIFVARWLRERLLAYGKRVSEPNVVAHAAAVMIQPTDAPPHDDHFHVRISCPAGMTSCIEQPRPRAQLIGSPQRENVQHLEGRRQPVAR